MSKISISAATPVRDVRAARILHDLIGLSYASACERLLKGPRGVFFTTELFLNDHIDKDRIIRDIVSKLGDIGVELFIMEIPHDVAWSSVVDVERVRISKDDLIAILDEAVGKYS